MQLARPAGNLPALQAAIDAGDDAGFRDQTHARTFPGLNFSDDELRDGTAYAHQRGRQVYLALNTYPDGDWSAQPRWQSALSKHAEDHQTTLGPCHRSWH